MPTQDQAARDTQPYLQGTVNGRFHANPAFADAINNGTVVHELPYRGELTQVVSTELGPFGRHSVFGVLRETLLGDQNSQWVAFPSIGAAEAWSRFTVAHWLANHSGEENRHFSVWRGEGWTVEIDHHRQRYTAVVGLAPGLYVECYDAAADTQEGSESRTVAEFRGWARLVELLPACRADWPLGMVWEHERVLAVHAGMLAKRDRKAATAAADQAHEEADPLTTEAVASNWWVRLRKRVAALFTTSP
ncbi:hypothetical protein ACIGZJ_31910 [Kitasatospora sp. NPDC052868]|uniref:hypothetical protein n=1 Tax=Kitasatospora sp. NPDC052868 TaxID=3364060 RepID=UPI0037CA1424